MMQTCSVNMDFVFLLLLSVTLCCGAMTTSNVSSTTNGSLPTTPLSTMASSAENITTAIVSANGTEHPTSNVSIQSTAAKATTSKPTTSKPPSKPPSKSPSKTPSMTPPPPPPTTTLKPGYLVGIMVILFLLIGVVIFIFVFMCQKYRKVSFRVNGKCDDHDETVPLENVQPLDAEAAGATAGVTGGIDNVVKETDEKTAVGDAPAAVDGTAGKDLKEETKQEAPTTSPSEGGDDKESIDTKNGPTVGESDEKDDSKTADDKDEEEEKKDGAKDEKSDSSSISLLSPDEISKATMAMESSPTEGSQETAAMNENSNNNNNNNNNIARASRQRVGGELVSSPLNPLGMTRSPAEMSAPAYVTMEKNAVWEDGAAAFSAL